MATTVPDRITASSLAVMAGLDFDVLHDCVAEGIQAIEMAEQACVALAVIHAKKFYKDTHHSFEAYVEETLGRSRRSGYRWVTFGKALLKAKGISLTGSVPPRHTPETGDELPERKASPPKSQRQAESAVAKKTAALDVTSRETTPTPPPSSALALVPVAPSFKSLLAVLAKMDAATEAPTVTDEEYRTFMKWVRALQAARQPAQAATAGAPPPAVVRDAAHQDQVRTYFKKAAKK